MPKGDLLLSACPFTTALPGHVQFFAIFFSLTFNESCDLKQGWTCSQPGPRGCGSAVTAPLAPVGTSATWFEMSWALAVASLGLDVAMNTPPHAMHSSGCIFEPCLMCGLASPRDRWGPAPILLGPSVVQIPCKPHASFLDTAAALRRMQKHPPKNIKKTNSNPTVVPATPGRTRALLRTAAGAGRQLQPVSGLQPESASPLMGEHQPAAWILLGPRGEVKGKELGKCLLLQKQQIKVPLIPSAVSCKFHELFLVLPWPKPSTPPLYPARAAWEGDLGTAGTGSAPGEFLEPLWEAASSFVILHTVSNCVSSVSAWTSYPPGWH